MPAQFFVYWLSVLPFVMLYGAYEGTKVVWLWASGFFLTLYWFIRLVRLHPLRLSKSGEWLLGWMGIVAIASLIGIHPVDSFIGGSYRHQGLLFFFTLLLILETVRQFSLKHRELLLSLLGFGVLMESVLTIEQKILAWSVRPLGTIGEPNALGGYLAVGFLWILLWPRLPAWMRLIFYVVTGVAIVATESRTALVCAVILTFGLGIRSLHRMGKHLFAIVGMVLVSAAIVGAGFMQYRAITQSRPPSVYENRLLFWRVGLGEFLKRPVLGYGAETEEVIYDNAMKLEHVNLVGFMIDRSHNIFLDVALWSGSIGLFVFIGWMLSVLYGISKKHDPRRVAAYIAWIVFACVQPLGTVHWVTLIFLSIL